jgi:hypothetical protein
MKYGDAIALGVAIDSPVPREWFRKCGLHTVLQEKCWVMLWRNLVYKTSVLVMTPPTSIFNFPTNLGFDYSMICMKRRESNMSIHSYRFLESHAPDQKVDGIPFSLLTAAFRCSYDVDEGWETSHIQSVIMSLVAQVRSMPELSKT